MKLCIARTARDHDHLWKTLLLVLVARVHENYALLLVVVNVTSRAADTSTTPHRWNRVTQNWTKNRKRMQLKYNLEKKREEGKQMRTKQKKRKNSNLPWYHVNTLMITGPARGSEFILKRNPLMVCVYVHYICYQPAKLCKTLLLHANTVFHPLEKLPVSVNHLLSLSLSLSLSFFLSAPTSKKMTLYLIKKNSQGAHRVELLGLILQRLRFAQFG